MTIYSHSLDNAIMLSSQDKVDFHLLGGKFYPKNRFYYALNEAELLQQISFDIAFIGAASVSDGLVSFEDEADAHLKRLALKHAKVQILLAEQDKWQKESKYILGPVSDFDYWITDQEPSPKVQELIGDKVKIIY
jgi:transcriptional repressor of sugar metabolism, glpR/deoR family, putative